MGRHAEDHLQPARTARTASSRQSPLPGVPLHHRGSPQRTRQTQQLSQPVEHEGRSYPGFNFFDEDDDALFQAIARGEFNISGLRNKNLRRRLASKSSAQISRLLKRLRLQGLIKKIGRTYKYYLTQFGKQVITTGLELRELAVLPQLAFGQIA